MLHNLIKGHFESGGIYVETLAINGGRAAIDYKLPTIMNSSGRDFGAEEMEQISEVIAAGNLGFIGGTKIKDFQKMWEEKYGVEKAVCVSSGTAALHTAINFLNLGANDEVLIPAITDIGSVLGVMLQGAEPVFVDVDPISQNIDPDDIERHITPRTKALMVVHLYGYPCDMDRIMPIVKKHNLFLIEDCAQAHIARYKGRLVGTFGDVSCFSFQQSKHMTTGDGGMVMAPKDELCGRKLVHCHDKAWPREVYRDHLFLAPNYHMTDLQAAVGIAQFNKLERLVAQRCESALYLSRLLSDIDGLYPPVDTELGTQTFFEYALAFDPEKFTAGNKEMAAALVAEGMACAPGYLPHPIYMYDVVTHNHHMELGMCPNAVEACKHMLFIPWSEKHTKQHAEDISKALHKVLGSYKK